jgi:hypothetical protein
MFTPEVTQNISANIVIQPSKPLATMNAANGSITTEAVELRNLFVLTAELHRL